MRLRHSSHDWNQGSGDAGSHVPRTSAGSVKFSEIGVGLALG